MGIKKICMLVLILCSLISVPAVSEKLSENIFLQNQSFMNNIFSYNHTWSVETVDSFGDVGLGTDIVVAADTTVFISYYDFGKKNLKCARFLNNAWSITVVDSEGDVGEYPSLALDSFGLPHISYYDATLQALKHAYFNGLEWGIEVVDRSGNVGFDTSIAIDSTNHIQTVDDTSVLYGSTCITFDPDGFVHFLYYDVTPDHFSLKHAYQSSDGWQIEIIDPYLWGVFGTGGANIAFDDQGRIHVGYFNWAWQTVNYAWKINGIWNLEIIDSEWEFITVGAHAALAVDSHGIPYVSYMDSWNIDLKYARKIEYSPGVPTPPSGSSRGTPGKVYTFATTSQDWDNDEIQYGWDWDGDYQVDQWSGFFDSGEICEMSHTWNESGSFNIRVIAMDEQGFFNGYHLNEDGEFSYWSDSLPITMPYSYDRSILQFLEWLFQRFPFTFPILRHILEF